MKNDEHKKTALLRVLQIIEQYTDENHVLTHSEIMEILEENYNIKIERKAAGRYIAILNEVGYEILTTKKGSYLMNRKFEDSELKLLIDGVLSSRYINPTHSKQLIEKLSSLSTEYFKPRIENVCSVSDWSKSDNAALFYNIDVIDEAISQKKKIKFSYNKYGADKKLHYVAIHIVSAFQMILHNQRYFLMAYEHKWNGIRYFRIDRITNISQIDEVATELRTLPGFENGIDYKRFSSSLPYMFADIPETVKFEIAGKWMLDQIVDWFGYNFECESIGDKLIITVNVSLNAMEYWLMQYTSFDYIRVKELLQDSSLFFTGDIENDFFKDGKNLAKKLFEYFKDRGKNATSDVVDLVFEDTKTLVDSSDNEKYIAYWLTRYDDFGLAYVTKMNEQHNNDLMFFKKFIKAFIDNCKNISKCANCFLDLIDTYNTVLTEHKTAIKLYDFLTNAVLWNKCVNELKTYAQQDDENFRQGAKTIDGITYSMVNKYRKLCCGYEESLIQELNIVMDDVSLRLHGKRYLNNLHHSKEKGTAQSTEVKLFTRETQANNRKKMIVGALIAVALIIVVTLIIVLIK